MNARFFIENSEVIGLWIIFSIIGLFIFNAIFEIVEKISKNKKIQRQKEKLKVQAIYNDAMSWRKLLKESSEQGFRKRYKYQFNEYVVKF